MIPPNPTDAIPPPLTVEEALQLLTEVDRESLLFKRSRELLDVSLEAASPVPQATPRGEPAFLTIGTTVYDDYDGLYFSIQAIRLYHPEILDHVEFLVIDNNPTGRCASALKALESWIPRYRYYPYRSLKGTSARDLLFREATGEFVLCIDCHVFFPMGALSRLIDYCVQNPESNDLLQGPLLWDDQKLSTHLDPVWWKDEIFYGYRGMDPRGANIDSPAFEIGMQGLGVFACRRDAWPGFNSRLAGFGGEEGYIQEKIRRAGGRALCLPFLRWTHRFSRPNGVPYENQLADRVRNYFITCDELGWDPEPLISHVEECLGQEAAKPMIEAAQAELASPFHFFDAIYCINLDRQPDRWQTVRRRLARLGIARKVRRFAAADTPVNHHIGCALSHRRIIAEAKIQKLETVLVLEDDVRFSPDASDVLSLALEELQGRDWQMLYLGGRRNYPSKPIADCRNLVIPNGLTCTHAIAYHNSVYDRILDAVPENPGDAALWIRANLAIDQFYAFSLKAFCFLVEPVAATRDNLLRLEDRLFEE